jgi:hypothetical protein
VLAEFVARLARAGEADRAAAGRGQPVALKRAVHQIKGAAAGTGSRRHRAGGVGGESRSSTGQSVAAVEKQVRELIELIAASRLRRGRWQAGRSSGSPMTQRVLIIDDTKNIHALVKARLAGEPVELHSRTRAPTR